MDAGKYVLSKTSKKHVLTVKLQNEAKISFKSFYKDISNFFLKNLFAFFQEQFFLHKFLRHRKLNQ